MKNDTTQITNNVSKLNREFHDFVDKIVSYGEDPAKWPLTREEQILFIRRVFINARKIRKMQEYLTESSRITSEDLSMAA